MVTLDNLLNILPILSLVIIGTYYSLQIRTQNKTRQAQLFMQLYDRFPCFSRKGEGGARPSSGMNSEPRAQDEAIMSGGTRLLNIREIAGITNG